MPSNNKIEFNKWWSVFWHHVEQNSQPGNCMLCGRKMESPCNSHVVPQFVLKGIAEKGMVCYGQSLVRKSRRKGLIKTTSGVKNAFTFRLICQECDQLRFCHYESPEAILDFNRLRVVEQKAVLAEMAIKTHLSHIYAKCKMYMLNEMQYPEEMQLFHAYGKQTAYEIDIKEHIGYIQTLTRFQKNSSFPFLVLFDHLLDYETDIATQTIIAYTHNLKGEQLFDPHDFSQAKCMRYFYLMILPCKGKTRVLFYIEKRYQSFEQSIIDDFNSLSEEEKLHFLFISLVIFDEQFYISPPLQKRMEKDKRIVKLYTITENDGITGKKEIANFRKYNNYLCCD